MYRFASKFGFPFNLVQALYFGLYEYFKKTFRDEKGHLSVPGQLCAGGLSGSGSWVLTYPLDVIKTRIQANDMHSGLLTEISLCLMLKV